MLYYKFNNYEGFKEAFGIMEHGNGVKSRRNKILLALLKDKAFFKSLRTADLKWRLDDENWSIEDREWIVQEFRKITDMAHLRSLCLRMFRRTKPTSGWDCDFSMSADSGGDDVYRFAHPAYELDNGGLCFDGDVRSVRYINHDSNDKVYKMKAGKFLRRLIDASQWCILPEQIKVWLCEDFAERWQAYSQQKVCGQELHISEKIEDFRRIYDSSNYESDFGSCMSHDGGDHADFYVNAVKAKAAWLTNCDGQITARCVIFTEAEDEDGNKWRLAERQYSSCGDNTLKRMLVDKLIAAGEIDAYKQVGVDCHNSRAWVANDGTSLFDKEFSIECNLESDDILSYQDSFKWYDYDDHVAYNYDNYNADYRLDETDLYFDVHSGRVYSEYYDEWIDQDEAIYVDSRESYFRNEDTRYCINTHQSEFVEDCVQLANGDYAYYGRDCEGYEGVICCPNCEEYFLEEDMRYSEILDELYCCDCAHELEQDYMETHKDEGFRYDCYDREWYDPDEWEDIEVLYWDSDLEKRVTAFSRRRNCSRLGVYDGVFYCGRVVWAWDKYLSAERRVPKEFTIIEEQEDGSLSVKVA